jgi:hypothetical protein
MKNATATSQGRSCLRESAGARADEGGITQIILRLLEPRAALAAEGIAYDARAYLGYFRPGRSRARLGVDVWQGARRIAITVAPWRKISAEMNAHEIE